MTDPRVKKLADNLVNFSCTVKPGENVLIESKGDNDELVIKRAVIRLYGWAGAA